MISVFYRNSGHSGQNAIVLKPSLRFGNGNFLPDPITESPAQDYQSYPSILMGWAVQHGLNTNIFRRLVHNITDVSHSNLDTLKGLVNDPKTHLIIAPTHPGFGDVASLFSVLNQASSRIQVVGNLAMFNAWGQFFRPLIQQCLSWLGFVPIHRDANDLKAIKAIIQAIEKGEAPVLIFPEGMQSFQAESVLPIRSGVAQLSLKAAKRLIKEKPDHRVVILPVGINFKFNSPSYAFQVLNRHLNQWCQRLRVFTASGEPVSQLTQLEGVARASLKAILARSNIRLPESATLQELRRACIEATLQPLEKSLNIAVDAVRKDDPLERCAMVRRSIYAKWHRSETSVVEHKKLMNFLSAVKDCLSIAKYDPNYVRLMPSPERIAETLFLLVNLHDPQAAKKLMTEIPRRACISIGMPINVLDTIKSGTPESAVEGLSQRIYDQLLGLVSPKNKKVLD